MFNDTNSRSSLVMGLGLVALLLFSANFYQYITQSLIPRFEHEHAFTRHIEHRHHHRRADRCRKRSQRKHIRIEVRTDHDESRNVDVRIPRLDLDEIRFGDNPGPNIPSTIRIKRFGNDLTWNFNLEDLERELQEDAERLEFEIGLDHELNFTSPDHQSPRFLILHR